MARLAKQLIFGAVVVCSSQAALAAPPSVNITYGQVFDAGCSILRGSSIQPEWKRELENIQPAFVALWAKSGSRLLAKVEELTGKGFQSDSVNVRLTLCDLPSDSRLGIQVNMRYALSSFTPQPVPLRYKVNVLAHELLHEFLREHPVSDSALLRLNALEDERVRNHLHLLALMKAALLELGEREALDELIRIDGQLPGGIYKRAWELVNQMPEEYMRYVREIRQ